MMAVPLDTLVLEIEGEQEFLSQDGGALLPDPAGRHALRVPVHRNEYAPDALREFGNEAIAPPAS
jgi:hypothetical protein